MVGIRRLVRCDYGPLVSWRKRRSFSGFLSFRRSRPHLLSPPAAEHAAWPSRKADGEDDDVPWRGAALVGRHARISWDPPGKRIPFVPSPAILCPLQIMEDGWQEQTGKSEIGNGELL
nr:unnamed protein product [Digitaria exilis]